MVNTNTLYTEATQWLDVREKKNNSGFDSVIFERKLLDVGWSKYAPWCAFFTKMITFDYVANSNLSDERKKELKIILSNQMTGSVVETFSRLSSYIHTNDEVYAIHNRILKPNSIAFFRYGKTSKGHAVIVGNELLKDIFDTIEGNSNVAGARDGVGVFARIRKNNLPYTNKGLNILGSITLNF